MDNHSIDLLLVEDNPNDAEITIRELKKHNLANHLFHVKDGEEALDFIFKRGKYVNETDMLIKPKLVLMDIKMPKMDGIDVLRVLKSDVRTKDIPVVMLTSSKEDPDIKKCYELGANSYIVKPVNFESFADSIRNIGFYWLLLNQIPNKK